MKPKHGGSDWLGNTHDLDFQCLNFLVHMAEIFNSFNLENAGKEISFNLYNKTQSMPL